MKLTFNKFWFWGIISFVALPVCLAAVYWSMKPAPIPAFQINSITGKAVQPASWLGKVVLVNFWATSCSSCVQEMPMLVDTHRKYQDKGFEVVAVAMSYDRPDYVLNFAQTRQLPFTVALDVNGEAAQAFGGIRLTPTSFLIGRDGQILKSYLGPPKESVLHQQIEATL